MIGTAFPFGSARSWPTSSTPLMSGSLISNRIRSGAASRTYSSAARPSAASWTTNPSTSSARRTTFRDRGLSSTVRITPTGGVSLTGGFRGPGQVRRYHPRQRPCIDRLRDVAIAPRSHRALGAALHCICGQCEYDDVARRRVGLDAACQLEAVHPGQLDVHQDDARPKFL